MTEYFQIKNSKLIYFLLFFLLIRLVVLFLFKDQIIISPDYFDQYRPIAYNILNGIEYGYGVSVDRTPIYPYLLAIVFSIFGEKIIIIQILQCLIDVFTCWIIYLIGKEIFKKDVGLVSMSIWGIYPMSIWQSMLIITENIFTMFLSFALLLFILSMKRKNILNAILSGGFLGLAVLTRPIAQFIPFGFVIYYFLNKKIYLINNNIIICFLISYSSIISPWIVRNYLKYNEIVISHYGDGQGKMRFIFEGFDEDFVYSHGEKRYQISDTKRDSIFAFIDNKSISKNEAMMNHVKTKLYNNPLDFIKLYFYKIWKSFTFTVTGKYDTYIKIVNVPLLILFIFGIYLERVKWKQIFIIVFIIIYFVGIQSLLITMFRYIMPVMPYIIILSSVSLIYIFTSIYQRRKWCKFS